MSKPIRIRAACTAALAVVLFVPASAQQPSGPLGVRSPRTGLLLTDEAAVKLIQTSSGDLAHQYVSRLALAPRVDATPEYEQAVEWVAQKAREVGLERVAIERSPADGKTRYLGYQPKRFWSVKRGELWMKEPFDVRLTSYAEVPFSLCRNSLSANVEADLVDIGTGLRDSEYPESVKGKIVLTSSDPSLVVRKAVRERGAAGVVSYWTIPGWDRLNRLPGDFPDLIGWRYLPEPPPGDTTGPFGFMISPRRARELQQLLEAGRKVRLRAAVEAELAPGTLDIITGIIPGARYPNEEITLSAHLDEIGADDNASGCATLLEVARTLRALIAAKALPPPLRTLRFVWGPEYGGTYAFLAKHLKDPVRRIATLNYDQVGANLVNAGAVFQFVSTPDSNPSFLNAVMASILDFMNANNDLTYPVNKDFHIISVKGTRDRLDARIVPYFSGSDHEIYNHLGIPAIFAVAWPERFYHSSADTPDKVDPTQLHRAAFSALAAAVTMAYADDAQASGIAGLSLVYARKRIGDAESLAAGAVLSADAAGLAEDARAAAGLVRHAYRRESAAIKSVDVFARTAAARKQIADLAALLDGGEGASLKQVAALSSERAAALGVPAPDFALTAAEQDAAHLFPRRKAGEELTAAGPALGGAGASVRRVLNEAERRLRARGEIDLRMSAFRDSAAWYADGRRSVLEIRDAVAAEWGVPLPIDAMELYFQAFEKAGVMTIERR